MRPAQQTISALSSQLAAGDIRSVEICRDVLAAIEEQDSNVKAYVSVDAEAALAEAEYADTRRANGETGALLGIPVGVKDLLAVTGQETRCGSQLLKGFVSPYDATSVGKLRAAGAVILGRLNMDEFAMGSTTENSSEHVTRNPVDPERVPGGSSGGSAAAVAAHTAIATLGSDTGGSIRQPASFCGCVGVKPTYGLVSRYGLTAYASSLDQIGPLTKTVEDAATVLQAIAGHDPRDSTSLKVDIPDYRAALSQTIEGLTLGVPAEYFSEGLDPEVEQSVRAAIAACEAAGATVREVSLPNTKYAIATYYIIATAEASANLARFDGVRYGARKEGADPISMVCNTRAAGFGPEVKRRIILGTYVLSSGYYDAYYLRAQKVRALIREDFAKAFADCDAIVGPVAPTPAYKIGETVDDPLQMYLGDIYTVPVNLAGLCGLSVPCGASASGLPIGLQVIGPPLGESTILRVASAVETTRQEGN